MTIIEDAIIGKKGEILPKKTIRQNSGLLPGDHVIIESYPNKIVIRKVLSVDEAFKLPKLGKGTPDEIEKELHEEDRLQEELSTKTTTKLR